MRSLNPPFTYLCTELVFFFVRTSLFLKILFMLNTEVGLLKLIIGSLYLMMQLGSNFSSSFALKSVSRMILL